MTPRHGLLALALLIAAGCNSGEAELRARAQEENSEELYLQYIQEYPNGAYASFFEAQLPKLRFAAAREANSSEAWKHYIDNHPEGEDVVEARRSYEEARWRDCEGENSVECWASFVEEFPRSRRRDEAADAQVAAEYVPHMSIEELEVREVNMAQNPDGPMDGWGVFARVTNNGEETLRTVKLRIDWLHPVDGETSMGHDFWFVAVPGLASGLPVPQWMREPMEPGESREFRFTKNEMPQGWDGQAGLTFSRIVFDAEE